VDDLKEDFDEKPRTEMALLKPEQRKTGFAEVEQGFSEAVARAEASRCLRCDLEK